MPMPPSHWVRLRQNRTEAPTVSSSTRTVAPVVVKPEADSNKASIIPGVVPLTQ